MLGELCWGAGRWEPARLDRGQVLCLPVLRARLAQGEDWLSRRRLERSARLLARGGVRRVFTARGFRDWAALERRGIRPVEGAPLCRFLAAALALAALERRGEDPARSAVTLRAGRVSRDVERSARLLCPVVRELFIDAGAGGRALAEALYREFGAAVCPEGRGAPVALCFDGERPAGEEGCLLRLWGREPDLAGLELAAPSLTVPEELEALPVLSALWESGRLKGEELTVKIT